MLFGYIGPDTVLPLTSALAAIAGFFLMTGRYGLRLVMSVPRKLGQLFRSRSHPGSATPGVTPAIPAGRIVGTPHSRRPTTPMYRVETR